MYKRGTTLIELLVVIVILLALAAVVVPVTHMVRSRSLLSGCANSLSQIGKAVLMYTDDYQGWLPCYVLQGHNGAVYRRDGSKEPRNYKGKPREWRDCLAVYTKSKEVFWCPADRFRGQAVRSYFDPHPEDARRQLYTSYVIWLMLHAGRPERIDAEGNLRVRPSALPLGPSRTIYLHDADWFEGPVRDGVQYPLSQHGVVSNLLLLDGSVRKIRFDEDIPWAREPR